nr:AAA family ATPase [uncultured Halomonas sp.]
MKILILRLANLASLPGPIDLDFTEAPLRDAGLFAITGPTGAGKSTLLDALCLALYGSTPRLRHAPVRDSQLPDVGHEKLTTADPRTLLRRGTASGYAEVDFLGRDGRRYRARWAVRRARNKAEGKLQAVEQSLHDLEDERLLTTQKKEFDRLLVERLGLSFDQFTRAVLLAQSEFAAFLKADDNERSELLEKLTDTAEYSEISKAAYRRASEARKRLDALEARLADDLPAEPEARAELKRSAEAAQRELDAIQQQAKHLEARRQWHATDETLRRAYAEGRQQQQDAESRWHRLADARTDREWRRLLAPQRHRLRRQTELPTEIARLETNHGDTLKAQEDATATHRAATEQRDQAEQTLREASQARQDAEPDLRQAREQAQRLATLVHRLADLETNHQQRQHQAGQLAEQRRQAEDQQRELERRRDELRATLQQLLGDHDRPESARQSAQQDHDRAARRHLALGELESRWQEDWRADQAHQMLARRLDEDEQRKEALVEQGKTARQRLDDQERCYRTVRDVVERNRAVRSESVVRLRESLEEGEPCPVCGGLDHPWRHHPPETPEAAQLKAQQIEEDRQLDEARQERDQAQQARDDLLGQYRALEAALAQHRQDLQHTEQRLAGARQALADHPLHAELAAIDAAERDTWLMHQRQASDATRVHHEQALQALARAETELAPLEEALHQGELELAQLETQRVSVEQELATLAEALPPLRRDHDEADHRLTGLLGEHPTPDAWQQQLDAHQESARQARDSALERLHEANRKREQLTQQASHEAEQIARLQQERDTLDRELAVWRQAHPALDDSTLHRLLAQSEDEAERQERQLLDAEEARQRSEASLAERRQALIAHRRGQGLASGGEDEKDEEGAKGKDDETLLADDVEAEIQRRRAALAGERDALAPRLEAAQQTRDDAVHALRDDDRRRDRQRQGQAERETARAEQRRWGQISELIGAADGKTFRRIAQAWNLERLLEEANAHLTGLTRRYRLERGGSELGLLVMDRDMGDERRSVHSLSGGETFLVSLALALGLASMASGQLAIESLFIDEGFGSLDPQSLALAMEALDGLQAQGRRVGVISHVQEMHERIPVQIQVEPMGNGTSRARLVSV